MISRKSRRATVSVVVPCLDEGDWIERAFESIPGDVEEVVVVDGGSADATVEIARRRAERVIVEPGGLARQLDRGAREARGEILLFLYADCELPEGGVAAIREALDDPEVAGGCFRLAFDEDARRFRVVAAGGNLRNRLGLGPFGDQGLFARREAFEACGGFRPDRLFPDHDLVRRLRRIGRFRTLAMAMRSSTRRWRRDGFLLTMCRHVGMSVVYALGKRRRGGWIERVLGPRGGAP